MDEPLDDEESDRVNPFAPAITQPSADELSRVNLPAHYWAAFAGALLLFIFLAFVLPGLGVPAVIALVAATIRVPCLQQRLSAAVPKKVLPAPVLLLFTSWVLVLVSALAAVLTFMVICIPAGIAASSIDQGNSVVIALVFGLSGLIALGAFVWLFYLSLRLPV